jgi:catabolite regulation protein CreA
VISSRQPQLLDLVAVLHPPDGLDFQVGDVGTVVELLPPDGIEVEFLDHQGKTRGIATFAVCDVLTLNRKRTPVG